ALPRRRVHREDFPHEERERIARRQRQGAVEIPQRREQILEPRHGEHSTSGGRFRFDAGRCAQSTRGGAYKWIGRVPFSMNNALEPFDNASGVYAQNGNPTPTLSEPLNDGGQFAPQSGGSGSGNIYITAKWQFNANALYQAPYGI